MAEQGVDGGKRLIQKQHFRLGDDGSCQRDTLLLAAGKLHRELVDLLRKADDLQNILHFFVGLFLRHFFHLEAEADVVGDAHIREQGILLEHHADAAVPRVDIRDILPVEINFAARDLLKAGETAQQRGLSAAGRPKKRDQLALFNAEADILQNMVAAKTFI